jgi:hypothetical protein
MQLDRKSGCLRGLRWVLLAWHILLTLTLAINGDWSVLDVRLFSKGMYADSTNDLQYLIINILLAVTPGFEL